MKQKTTFILIFVLIIIILAVAAFFFRNNLLTKKQTPLNLAEADKKIMPSETFIEYNDPSGFSFSYPDNLSISKSEIEDINTYSDLEIYSNQVNGSLKLKVTDTKIATLSAWLKENKIPDSNKPVEKKLGNLLALEVKTSDTIMLGALDQGVLFTIQMPLIEEKFWLKVYEKIISDFTFGVPAAEESTGSSVGSESDIFFEGEEVVE